MGGGGGHGSNDFLVPRGTGVGVEGGGLIERVGLQWIPEITNPFITKFPKYRRYGI